MSNDTSLRLSEKYIEITGKIKAYTFETPGNRGSADFSYRSYLAVCSKLFNYDMRLQDLCYAYDFDNPDHFAMIEEELFETEKEVNHLLNVK